MIIFGYFWGFQISGPHLGRRPMSWPSYHGHQDERPPYPLAEKHWQPDRQFLGAYAGPCRIALPITKNGLKSESANRKIVSQNLPNVSFGFSTWFHMVYRSGSALKARGNFPHHPVACSHLEWLTPLKSGVPGVLLVLYFLEGRPMLPSGKLLHNYGKSRFLMGKSTT